MSDNLKDAKECGATVEDVIYPEGTVQRVTFHTNSAFENYTSRILASQQAAHEAEIASFEEELAKWIALSRANEPLRREVAMLRKVLFEFAVHEPYAQEIGVALSDTKATAEAYEREVEARGAVKALEKKAVWIEYEQAAVHKDKNKFTEGYRQACSDIAGILKSDADSIRATTKKEG